MRARASSLVQVLRDWLQSGLTFDRCQNQQDMHIVVTIVMDMHLTLHIVNIRDPGNCGYARRFDQVRT